MTESRLFKILYYLLDKGTATAPELAERFEVSARTIYRTFQKNTFPFRQYFPTVKNQFLSSQTPAPGTLPSILTLLHPY